MRTDKYIITAARNIGVKTYKPSITFPRNLDGYKMESRTHSVDNYIYRSDVKQIITSCGKLFSLGKLLPINECEWLILNGYGFVFEPKEDTILKKIHISF